MHEFLYSSRVMSPTRSKLPSQYVPFLSVHFSWFSVPFVSFVSGTFQIGAVTVPVGVRGVDEMKYKVHRFEMRMTEDETRLEEFLNSLEGEVVAIVPNTTMTLFTTAKVDFLLIIEKLV